MKNHIEYCEEDVEKEKSLISTSYAIVNPGTVVVKSLYTSITYVAVSAPVSPNHLTVRTQGIGVKVFK